MMTRPAHFRLTAALLLLLVLAACGGDDNGPQVAGTATPAPTLEFDERITFSPGLPENPLRLVIRPVKSVDVRIQSILVDSLAVPPGEIAPDADLRDDLAIDASLTPLNAPLNAAFGVQIAPQDAESIVTVGDLVMYVQSAIGDRVERAIFDQTSLYFEVILANSYAQALAELCNSGSGIVAISWLDGVTYAAAQAENCGQAALEIGVRGSAEAFLDGLLAAPEAAVPESTPEATEIATSEATAAVEATEQATEEAEEITPTAQETETVSESDEATPEIIIEVTEAAENDTEIQVGTAGLIILNRDLGTDSIDALRQRAYCRIGYGDFYSWFLPSLVMQGNNIDPSRDLGVVTDYADLQALIEAVSSGDCAAAGLSLDALVALQELMPEETANIRIADETTPFPYGILMYPLEIELGVRLTLNDLFTEFDSATDAGAALQWLLGQDVIVAIPEDGLRDLDAFMAATGLDFAQLGN